MLDFFTVGAILLITFLSLRRGTGLSDKCRPGTLHSTAIACFTKSPSPNWILTDSWSVLFPVLFLYIFITFGNFPFVPYSFAHFHTGHSCCFRVSHLPQNREKHECPFSVSNSASDKTCCDSFRSKYIFPLVMTQHSWSLSYSRRLTLTAKTRLCQTVLCLCLESETTVVSIHISIKKCYPSLQSSHHFLESTSRLKVVDSPRIFLWLQIPI
jgi:hypothetical protein